MGECNWCGKRGPLISAKLGACADCLRSGVDQAITAAESLHRISRTGFQLPELPPADKGGIACDLCAKTCVIGVGQRGYCGVRHNMNRRLQGGDVSGAKLSWYHDPLPTNCVADWVCPAGSGAGYPEFSHINGPELGYTNLAVFYEACSFDCLFCQNWRYRENSGKHEDKTPNQLAGAADGKTACICHFGGDPGPQAQYAIEASRLALARQSGKRILRICWETNGSQNPQIFDEMVGLSLESGGCVKIDLKAFDTRIHRALCGAGNRRTFSNFERAARRISERLKPPLLVASTLLVPGYVDAEEVGAIARFIADLDPAIPYALLGFHPDFLMNDLPPTSLSHAREAEAAAKDAGLTNVHIGNRNALGRDYDKTTPISA